MKCSTPGHWEVDAGWTARLDDNVWLVVCLQCMQVGMVLDATIRRFGHAEGSRQ
jgi:hypothetical protein